MHQNIAGVLSKLDELILTIDRLEKEQVVDVICLSETFIKKGDEDNVIIQGYKLDSSYCRQNTKRGGVCIISKDELETKDLIWTNDLAVEKHFEVCGIQISTLKINIFCIYRTPDADIELFMHKLDTLLEKALKTQDYKIVICGDFNIDFLKDDLKKKN